MSSLNSKKLIGGAAAAAAIGFLISPAPAQALPPFPLAPADCAGYQFPGGRVSLHYPVLNAQTEFDTIAGGTHVDTQATTKYPQSSMPGTVIGDINGNNIHLKITRQGAQKEYPPLILDGAVGPDDRGHGTYTYEQGSGNWDSIEAMKCIPKPKEEPKPEPVAAEPAPPAEEQKQLAPDNAAAPQEAQAPAEPAAPAAEPAGPCIPDPFDLNFPGAC
jgi:hypothetical protein